MHFAKPAGLNDESLILYFIKGVSDSKLNKIVLYQARTFYEPKKQLRVYEKVRDSRQLLSREVQQQR